MNKALISALVVGAVAGLLAFFGLTPFGQTVVQQVVGGSGATGNTFNSAKVAMINMAPLTAAATTTSILNGDATDRVATFFNAYCTGLTTVDGSVAALNVKIATTSVSATGLQGNTNYVANVNIATSTSVSVVATSTPAIGGLVSKNLVWPTGTYLTFLFNATTTAACTVGVSYLAT